MTDLTYEELIKKEIDVHNRENVLENYKVYDKRLKKLKETITSHEEIIKEKKK